MTTLAESPAAAQTRSTTLPDVTAAAALGDVHAWVDAVAGLTEPDAVVWCDGSDEERRALVALSVRGAGLRSRGRLRARPGPPRVSRRCRSRR